MRFLRVKLKICWLLLTDQFTHSERHGYWWLWRKGDGPNIAIRFEKRAEQ